MAKKSRMQTVKINEEKKIKRSDRRKYSKKGSEPIRVETKVTDVGMNRREKEEIVFAGLVSGNPSLVQSNFGFKGNFELVVPMASGGLAHYWRNNDDPELPWYGPVKFGHATDRFNSSEVREVSSWQQLTRAGRIYSISGAI